MEQPPRLRLGKSVFSDFKPYDELLFECTTVLTEICSSIWLCNLPAYKTGPQKTVVRFRMRQSSQEMPIAILSAFKHHMENITHLGDLILSLRKSLVWIEEHERELSRLTGIFQWKGGLSALANEIQLQQESLLQATRMMDKLGSLSYRLPGDQQASHRIPTFKAKALVQLSEPLLGFEMEAGAVYTVVNQNNPFMWKLVENGRRIPSIFLEPSFSGPEERLCERAQNLLDSFKSACFAETCQVLISKLDPDSHHKGHQSPRPHLCIPTNIRHSLLTWLESIEKVEVSWEPVEQFWRWWDASRTRSELITDVGCGLRFIEALFQIESSTMTEYLDESGFNEPETITPTQHCSVFINRWNAKMEMITKVKKDYSWKGNLQSVTTPMCSQDPRTMPTPEALNIAKKFTSNLIK